MRVGILFSGGKDSMLAMHVASRQGHKICCLISFQCQNQGVFDPINLEFTELAAKCLHLPLQEFHLSDEPQKALLGVRDALKELKRDYKLQAIVTGAKRSSPAFTSIQTIASQVGLRCLSPLAATSPKNVLYTALKNKYEILVVQTNGYKGLLGTVLDSKTLSKPDELKRLDDTLAYAKGSMILDTPLFRHKIRVVESKPVQEGTLMRLLVTGMVLEQKPL